MNELQRLTTEYVETEDRFRLAGEIGAGAPVVFWLTQRLLQRLLPPLLQGLEKEGGAMPRPEALHSFAQQKAQAAVTVQAPVRAATESSARLVTSIDVGRMELPGVGQAVRLTFKSEDGPAAGVTMNTTLLRQWLGILYVGYRKADWPLHCWPDWMSDAVAPANAVLH